MQHGGSPGSEILSHGYIQSELREVLERARKARERSRELIVKAASCAAIPSPASPEPPCASGLLQPLIPAHFVLIGPHRAQSAQFR